MSAIEKSVAAKVLSTGQWKDEDGEPVLNPDHADWKIREDHWEAFYNACLKAQAGLI